MMIYETMGRGIRILSETLPTHHARSLLIEDHCIQSISYNFLHHPSPQPTDLIHPDDERKPRHGHDPALPDDELTTDPWRTVAAATGITVPRPDDVHAVALEDALDHVLGGVGAQKDEAAGARARHGREPGRLR